MLRRFLGDLRFAFLIFSCFPISLVAQQNCPVAPSIQPVSQTLNIFSDQQEIDLGDAMAESLGQRTKVIYDDKLNTYLRKVGDSLVQHLPPSQMKFRFYLIELPEVNAFSIAGGRVYVSRKIVALAKTDDELAGVLAHELGHIVTHQSAIETTTQLRALLNVTQVFDRKDIFDKYHRLLENEARLRARGRDREEGQYVADQVALYAMARAGYAPHAYVDLWDRFQQTHGKTGSWLSDIFGTTKPSERRLREMLKNVSALPAGCAETPPHSLTEEFAQWQAEVIAYSGLSGNESLPGLVFKQTLALPLRPDVSNLRFSSNGKYILAQDEGGIHVLTRDPLAVFFYIPALDASNAAFTPDSQSIVFHNRSLRVESWSVTSQQRTSVHELTLLHPCLQTELSPDGSAIGCLNSELELLLIDVASGATLAGKKSFIQLNWFGHCLATMSLAEGDEARLVKMKFSPDGRYFLAGGSYEAHFAWDLASHHEATLPSSIKDAVKASFAFLGADRVVGVNASSPSKSPILRFPSGERLGQIAVASNTQLNAVAHGDYLLAGPTRNGPMGLFDVKAGTLPITFKTRAADFYDGTFVTERLSGELSLHTLPKGDTLATIRLPQARLAVWRAAAVSDDFDWMTISNRSRGAIWDVSHNIRTAELRSFRGAWFAADHTAYFDFPKVLKDERQIARLNPLNGGFLNAYKVGDEIASQHGPYLLVTKGRGASGNGASILSSGDICFQMLFPNFFKGGASARNQDLELRDIRDGHVVWSRYFPQEVPAVSFAGRSALLRWSMADRAARDEIARFPELKPGTENTDYLLEEIDLQKDTVVGKMVIKTNKGSFSVRHAVVVGDWVIVSASHDQILAYSMSTGQQKGHFFGTHSSSSPNGLLAVETESGHLNVYELEGSRLKQQYTFPDPISFSTFSHDGKRLFVMTASQTAYILDVTASTQANQQATDNKIAGATH